MEGANASFGIEGRGRHDETPFRLTTSSQTYAGEPIGPETRHFSILFPVSTYEQTIMFIFANLKETLFTYLPSVAWKWLLRKSRAPDGQPRIETISAAPARARTALMPSY